MNAKDKEFLSKFRVRLGAVSHDEYKMICEIHAREFNHEVIYVSKCAKCGYVQMYLDQISEIYLKETDAK